MSARTRSGERLAVSTASVEIQSRVHTIRTSLRRGDVRAVDHDLRDLTRWAQSLTLLPDAYTK